MSGDHLRDPEVTPWRATAEDLTRQSPTGTAKTITEGKGSALAVQVGGCHYPKDAIQPIEYIQSNKLGFIEGSVVKYITRYKDKGGPEDIRKIIHYCELLLELEYELER